MVDERTSHAMELDLNPVTVLKRCPTGEGELHCAEKVDVHVPRDAKLWVFEKVVLQIGQRMVHVLLTRQKFARIVDHLYPAIDAAKSLNVLERMVCNEFRPDGASAQFGVAEP